MENQEVEKQEVDVVTTAEQPNLKGWNWGAAFLSIVWGIGNKSYLTLFSLIPVVDMFWWIICGINGNRWAWESGMFEDAKTFRVVQQTWNRAGITAMLVSIISVVLFVVSYSSLFAMLALYSQSISY